MCKLNLKKNISNLNQWQTFVRIISVITLLFFLHSCMYETNQLSEIDVKQPPANHPLTLSLSVKTDSLIIFGETNFQYDVNTFGLNFTALEIDFNGITYQMENASGKLTLTPDYYNTKDWLDLTIKFYAATGSGSIADKFKAENYIGSKTWKVKYIDLGTHDFSLHQRITSDSILEIYYVNPHNVDTLLGKLYKDFNTVMKVAHQNGDTLFFSDSTYYGGMELYQLEVSNHLSFSRYYNLDVDYPQTSHLSVADINKDSCLVSWTYSRFKIDYKVMDSYIFNNPNIYYTGSGHSFKDKQPQPNWGKFYYLYTRSRYNKSSLAWGLSMSVYWKDHVIF